MPVRPLLSELYQIHFSYILIITKTGDSYRQLNKPNCVFPPGQKLLSILNILELLQTDPGYEPVRKQGRPLVSSCESLKKPPLPLMASGK